MRIVDLKKEQKFLEQYIELRNSYCELLLTLPVELESTKEWLDKNGKDVEILGILHDNTLTGVSILYINKNGEVALFVKDKNKGIGTKLLGAIEETARFCKLPCISAWVMKNNTPARHVFEKNGFINKGDSTKEYKGRTINGISYKKIIT